MSLLAVRTDGILSVEPDDVELLRQAHIEYREATCRTEDDVIAAAQGAAALLVLAEPITAAVMDALPDLQVIARFGVGVDTVDIDAASERGIRVVNVPDANTSEVATHALALILTLVRRIAQHNVTVQAGNWGFAVAGVGTRRITELVVGIVGYGRTGKIVADNCRHLGFRVLVHDPICDDEVIRAAGLEPVDLDDLVREADVLSLHIPATEETRHILNAERIAQMKSGAIVVNVSRGGLVDEQALAAAVESGRLAGAGLDTMESEPLPADSPLRGNANILLTPHAAHYSAESYRDTVHRAYADVVRVLTGQPPRDPVN